MPVATEPATRAEDRAAVEAAQEPVHTQRTRWGYVIRPAFVGTVLLALYLWINSRELDSIEARLLNWDQISRNTIEHLQLTFVSTVLVVAIAVPLGILLTRSFARPITPPILAIANIGQAVPSIGILVLVAGVWLLLGFWAAIIALVAYANLPVLRNTMVGLEQVDPSVLESARGMGLTKRQALWRIELPLAVPVILAGIRTALIINVGTATLATFINAGGLGDIINGGIVLSRDLVKYSGAILVASLALLVDWVADIAEDKLRPRGL